MKLFNGILGVFSIFAAIYCFWYPGISFLNAGWMVTILLVGWGVCVLFETATNHGEGKPDKITVVKGIIALASGVVTGISAILSGANPEIAIVTDKIIVYIFILWLVISGFSSMLVAVTSIKILPRSRWIMKLILGVLTLLAGVYGAYHVFLTAWTVTIMFGALLLVYGGRLLASVFE